MQNLKIRELIKKSRLKHYEIAEELGINETSFSRLLRKELSENKFIEVSNAIKSLTSKIGVEG